MADITRLKAGLIEKQEIILNRLPQLTHDELLQLMASLSSLISNLDRAQAEEEVQYNRLIVQELARDAKGSVMKAEAIVKASDAYLAYKNVMSLKQFAVRGMNIVKIHMQHLLNSRMDAEDADEKVIE